MKTILKLFLLTFLGCAIGRQGVYLNEMQTTPSLSLNNGTLTVKTTNSVKNSALLIYKVNVSVDQNKKEIYLSADQAAGKDYKENFVINLNDYKIIQPTTYTFYWLDPDKKTTKLDRTEK